MTSRNQLILGVDGGGTSTVACLADANNPSIVLGRGTGGPSNPQSVGPVAAASNLEEAIRKAFLAADQDVARIASACLGLAGVDRDTDRRWIEDWAARIHLAHQFKIVNDAIPILYAGTSNGTGVALIVGTGSLAFGRRDDGRTARSGGWGHLLGDEGSGYSIALAGLRAAVRSSDGRGSPTQLLRLYLKEFDRVNPQDLITAVYQPDMNRAKISGMAKIVFDASACGDVVASSIVTQAASELASMIASVVRQLGLIDDSVEIAITGGIIVNQPILQERLIHELRQQDVCPRMVTVVTDPVAGALILAASLLA